MIHCLWSPFERWSLSLSVMNELSRRISLRHLNEELPGYLPQYEGRQSSWEKDAWTDILDENYESKTGYVRPFSPEELPDLCWEVAFWVMKGLHAQYDRKKKTRLSWEAFLSVIQKRENIRKDAAFVARCFAEVSRPDLSIWDRWEPSRRPGGEVQQLEQFKQIGSLSLVMPPEYLEEAAAAMATHLAVSLYIQKKSMLRHRNLAWRKFRAMLEADPILRQILSHQVRWAYALNPETLRILWARRNDLKPILGDFLCAFQFDRSVQDGSV